MDDIKDIQKTDSVSRFFDDTNIRTNPFGENRAADRAYRRSERIVAAIYLLTNHIPESESIRSTVRTASQGLLASILSMRDEMRSPQSRSVHALQSSIRHLISLVRILNVSGFISSQNTSTMIEALDELGNFLAASQRSILSENVTISRDELVDVHMGSHVPKPAMRMSRERAVTIKDTVDSTAHVSMSNTVGKGDMSVRVQSILDILSAGGSLGIKDIAANLPEYSEKMIQRELLDLTTQGKILKEGLKRWSKYSLAK
jgi:hypothetical protein